MVFDPAKPNNIWQLPIDEALQALGSDRKTGLSEAEARERLTKYGRNELAAKAPIPVWRKFLAQFQDILVILLLIAALISAVLWTVERDAVLPYEALAIFAVVLLNATIGFIQESKAEAAVAALRARAADTAAVVRDGAQRSIPAVELVPGDLMLIEGGDTIAADARVIESIALHTAEAALTGESLPVSKESAPIPDDVALGDRTNLV